MEDIMRQIEAVEVKPKYDIPLEDYMTIYEHSGNDVLLLMHYGFLAGYLQGQKAEQSKQKAIK